MGTAASMLSVFIREPEFQGQTKDKLATAEATKIVETAVRDAFDHWLADFPQQATKLLEWTIDQSEERLKRRREKEVGRQSATGNCGFRASSPIARSSRPPAPKSSLSKAIPPAAAPRARAIARRRLCCPCAAKF